MEQIKIPLNVLYVVLYFVTLEKICHERLKILEKTHNIP